MLAVLAVAVLLTGCRLSVVADVDVGADGSGTVGVVFELDEVLLDELDTLGVDPTAELEAAALGDDAWRSTRTADEDGVTVTLQRDVTQASDHGDALRSLVAGLSDQDPALLVDIDVVVGEDGGSRVDGIVGFRPPSSAGIAGDGDPLGPDADELRAIVERSVAPSLTVTLPGRPEQHDADVVEGRTLRWEVPVGGERAISAVAVPQPWWLEHVEWVVAGAVALLLAILLAVRFTRRRR